jgi:hypothetical protein
MMEPGYACDRFFEYAMHVASDPQEKTVVFGAYWEAYFGYEEGGDRSSRVHFLGENSVNARSGVQLAELAFHDYELSIRSLHAHGKRVFIILLNPASADFDIK